eukprot:3884940-Alexandrium_andersonii.AAC.1
MQRGHTIEGLVRTVSPHCSGVLISQQVQGMARKAGVLPWPVVEEALVGGPGSGLGKKARGGRV